MIIVDTSIWVAANRNPQSVEAQELQRILRREEPLMLGVVLAELLQGARGQREIDILEDTLLALPYREAGREAWHEAGMLGFRLRQGGQSIPLTDAVIATVALREGHQVYTMDQHFLMVPGLQLHQVTAK